MGLKIIFRYKTYLILVLAGLSLAAFLPVKKTLTPVSTKGFAVVELFTSEGCSSCPAADATVERLLSKKMDNVFILAFHVDYWDRLGWKDPFSNPAFSQRQSSYAAKFQSGSVYTPQVIVNGESEFVGSDEKRLLKTVSASTGENATETVPISITATKANATVVVKYNLGTLNATLLNIALVEPAATSIVKRGENGGRTLHHVNIVRAFKSIEAKGSGSLSLELSADIQDLPLQIIAYTQSGNTYHISGAVQTAVQ